MTDPYEIFANATEAERDELTRTVIPKPTAYGQRIIDLLCDRLEASGYGYWVPPMGSTEEVIKWLSNRMGKPIRSVAGAVSDLIGKEILSTAWEHESDGQVIRVGKDISVTTQGWCHWAQWSTKDMEKTHGFSLEEWLDWDGIDGTEIGYEFEVRKAGMFRL